MLFTKYTPDDYDKHGYLKPPIGFYFILALLLRAYLVLILSVANRSDATALITSLYPNKYDFFAGLVVGIGALIVTIALSLRREKAQAWMAKIWHKGKWFLWTSWLLDLILTLYVIKKHKFNFEPQFALVMLGLFFAAWFMLKNSRLNDAFANWPVESYAPAKVDEISEEQQNANANANASDIKGEEKRSSAKAE